MSEEKKKRDNSEVPTVVWAPGHAQAMKQSLEKLMQEKAAQDKAKSEGK